MCRIVLGIISGIVYKVIYSAGRVYYYGLFHKTFAEIASSEITSL